MVFADIDEGAAERAALESKTIARNPLYRATALRVDVSDDASVEEMVDNVMQTFGRIDYAVNSAGVREAHPGLLRFSALGTADCPLSKASFTDEETPYSSVYDSHSRPPKRLSPNSTSSTRSM